MSGGYILTQTHCWEPSSHLGWSCCAHGGGGGGGGTSTGAYGGAYAGRTTYQSGTAGCGWHSPVQTFRDQLRSHCGELVTQCVHTVGSHCGELTPGAATVTADVATAAAASGIDATAVAAARRPRNPVMAGLPLGLGATSGVLQLMCSTRATNDNSAAVVKWVTIAANRADDGVLRCW
jgi:hypothetical protein